MWEGVRITFKKVDKPLKPWVKTDLSSMTIVPGWGTRYLQNLWVSRSYDGRPWVCGSYPYFGIAYNTSLKCVRDDDVREELLRRLLESEEPND